MKTSHIKRKLTFTSNSLSKWMRWSRGKSQMIISMILLGQEKQWVHSLTSNYSKTSIPSLSWPTKRIWVTPMKSFWRSTLLLRRGCPLSIHKGRELLSWLGRGTTSSWVDEKVRCKLMWKVNLSPSKYLNTWTQAWFLQLKLTWHMMQSNQPHKVTSLTTQLSPSQSTAGSEDMTKWRKRLRIMQATPNLQIDLLHVSCPQAEAQKPIKSKKTIWEIKTDT
jgi:hypothetical protein